MQYTLHLIILYIFCKTIMEIWQLFLSCYITCFCSHYFVISLQNTVTVSLTSRSILPTLPIHIHNQWIDTGDCCSARTSVNTSLFGSRCWVVIAVSYMPVQTVIHVRSIFLLIPSQTVYKHFYSYSATLHMGLKIVYRSHLNKTNLVQHCQIKKPEPLCR